MSKPNSDLLEQIPAATSLQWTVLQTIVGGNLKSDYLISFLAEKPLGITTDTGSEVQDTIKVLNVISAKLVSN